MSKVSKRRNCPALQTEITSQECGEHRNSKVRCTSDCSFNLFAPANYSQLLEAEGRIDQVAFEILTAEPVHAAAVRQRIEKAGFEPYAVNNAVLKELFFVRDSSGATFGQRWEKTGFPQLKNDLRCLFRAKMGIYIALSEVLRVIDADSIQCRDLLNPSRLPFTVFDRSSARMACRHDVLLGHCYDLPHFTRFFGTAIPIPHMGTMEPEQIVREIVAHLGGPVEAPHLQGWLVDHPTQFAEALGATIQARHAASLAAADLKVGKALYRLRAPYSECRAALDGVPDVVPESLTKAEKDEGFAEHRIWFESSDEARLSLGRETLGTILLGQTFWRLEAISQKRMDRLRSLFEAALGLRVELDTVRMDDLRTSKAKDSANKSLVPPSLLVDLPQLSISSSRISPMQKLPPGRSLGEQLRRLADSEFLDDSVPALDGATPRAAAQNSNLLPKLRLLLKQRINDADRNNLEEGGSYDASWLAAELGQTDLCAPAPPPRARPDPGAKSPIVGPKIDLEALVPAPALPLHLPEDQVLRRIEEAMVILPSVEEAETASVQAGCNWLEILDALPDDVSDADYSALASALMEVWFVMVPVGHYAPEIPLEKLVTRLSEYQELALSDISDVQLKEALRSRYQSPLGQIATRSYLEIRKKLKPKPKASDNVVFPVVMILAAIDEMHLALGGATTQ